MNLQESGEMYLETIYILSQKYKDVRAIDVGEYMGYSKPSVSRAVGLLKSGGYLVSDELGHLSLTESGVEEDLRAPHAADPISRDARRQRRDCGRGCVQDGAHHKRRVLPRDKAARRGNGKNAPGGLTLPVWSRREPFWSRNPIAEVVN